MYDLDFDKIPDDLFINARQVAAYLGCSHRTIANWRYAGAPEPGLPYSKIGRAVRYRMADVRAFADARAVNTVA